ncbi:response regulator transcription factor [Phenylobacterium deserti]|uniref:DNA-binding response regulator n=1 Tax=Phenylobacterium deserti TaxID=1914756 RepID=A0A328AUC0_9CAUL|nr:response regulator [Phenylobacterium deserti]RAK57286.1 DNA-binding response regulator [Phenylobacterium deserti]
MSVPHSTDPTSAPAKVVHLVDDDPLLREYAAITLTYAGYDVVQHESGVAFLRALDAAVPGCVLLDIHMPEIDGFGVLQALSERHVTWPVVVLTARKDVRSAVEAMKRGAFEFLQKPFAADGLLAVLTDAFEKLETLSEEAARAARARSLIDTLSARELQVLRGMLGGLPNKLIAYELDLSVRTVEIYRGKVMDKLNVRGLSSAVRLALAAGVEPLVERDTA